MLKSLFSKKAQPNFQEVLALNAATSALCSRIEQVMQKAEATRPARAEANFNRGFVKQAVSRAA